MPLVTRHKHHHHHRKNMNDDADDADAVSDCSMNPLRRPPLVVVRDEEEEAAPTKVEPGPDRAVRLLRSRAWIVAAVALFFLTVLGTLVILLVSSSGRGEGGDGNNDNVVSSKKEEQEGDNGTYCRICPVGFVLSTPTAVFDRAASPFLQNMTCEQVLTEAKADAYDDTTERCGLVQEQAADVCDCEKIPVLNNIADNNDTARQTTVAPVVTSVPTPRPTGLPVVVTPAPQATSPPFAPSTLDRNRDRFSYGATRTVHTHNSFGPQDWSDVDCPDKTSCLGWPDTWEHARGWSVRRNHCQWCPDEADDGNNNSCGTHHQSPIDLRRDWAIESSNDSNECIDVHEMRYEDGSCTFEHLRDTQSFRVDRHALRIVQPLIPSGGSGNFVLNCRNDDNGDDDADDDGGGIFPRVDFSRGFSNYWYMSHTDFHLPSEHTQDGKRYDAELQMYHFYSVTGSEAGVDNEMGTVAVFLQAYDDAPDYAILNEVICAWREDEEMTRVDCGLPAVDTPYEGCPNYSATRTNRRRQTIETGREQQMSVNDLLVQNILLKNHLDSSHEPKQVDLTEPLLVERNQDDRNLFFNADTNATLWHNYFALNDVKTQYYYRYSGTQTIPPCYGTFIPGDENRKQTNHWRYVLHLLLTSSSSLLTIARYRYP